jgi:hypothetical protein
MNTLCVVSFAVFFIIINRYGLTLNRFFLIVAIIVLFQTVMTVIRMNSSRVLVPIIDEVRLYEKQRMGNEWFKQKRVATFMNLFYSGLLFFIVFIPSSSSAIQMNLSFVDYSVISVVSLLIINLSMIIHIRKVDRSSTPADLKGYTMKSTFMALLAGVGLAAAIILLAFTSVFSQL